jgi:hypothetical protein
MGVERGQLATLISKAISGSRNLTERHSFEQGAPKSLGTDALGTDERGKRRLRRQPEHHSRNQSASRRYREGTTTMARKDSILKLRDLLVKRRDALRKALAGDLSLLKALRDQTSGDVVDAALDAPRTKSARSWLRESRELANIEVAQNGFAADRTAPAKSQRQDSLPRLTAPLRHHLHRVPAGE